MFDSNLIEKHHNDCEAKKAALARDGAWNSEPNRIEWKHKGLTLLMSRHPSSLHWCGYVGLPPGHPDYGKGYDEVDVDVHGGLTYARGCQDVVCHRPDPGEADELHWFGFDLAHGGDLSPFSIPFNESFYKDHPEYAAHKSQEQYRGADYVRAQTISLAEQLLQRAS